MVKCIYKTYKKTAYNVGFCELLNQIFKRKYKSYVYAIEFQIEKILESQSRDFGIDIKNWF